MHSFPFWTRVASVLAERSRSASQALGYPCSRWLLLPVSALSLSRPVGAPSPHACARSLTSDS
eukprot:321209-Pleurochrysis_carterae.AAC.1